MDVERFRERMEEREIACRAEAHGRGQIRFLYGEVSLKQQLIMGHRAVHPFVTDADVSVP